MDTRRPTNHRTTAVAVAVLVAAAGVIGVADLSGSAAESGRRSTLEPREHEARRHLAEVRAEQERVLNPREHLAHRDVAEAPQVGATSAPSTDPCTVTLERAWQRLGHFSDGYQSYLLSRPPCAGQDRSLQVGSHRRPGR